MAEMGLSLREEVTQGKGQEGIRGVYVTRGLLTGLLIFLLSPQKDK